MHSHWRTWALWAGPPVLLSGSYMVSMGTKLPVLQADGPPRMFLLPASSASPERFTTSDPVKTVGSLEQACVQTAYEYQKKLDTDVQTLVAAPFVIVGDVSIERLRDLHEEVIVPSAEAMWATYFSQRPTRPVVIVLTSSEKRFQQLAWDWDRRRPRGYYGYYLRDERRLVVNLSTGAGTLTHELTHALSQADCPHLPEWFDEGLASLHEHCEIDDDGGLVGLSNWRTRLLADLVQRTGVLPLSVDELMRSGIPRDADQQLRYAMARSLCLWLQERDQLGAYYLALRRGDDDLQALQDLVTFESVDAEFLAWLTQARQMRKVPESQPH